MMNDTGPSLADADATPETYSGDLPSEWHFGSFALPSSLKPWDKPKEEQCEGFTLDEFARLDLSRMDFSEVYAEFTDAARLPDELETSILIQQKIDDYYARGGQ